MNKYAVLLLLFVMAVWGIWPALSIRAAWQSKIVPLVIFAGLSVILGIALVILAQWWVSKPVENLAVRYEVQGLENAILRVAGVTIAMFCMWVALAGTCARMLGNGINPNPWTGYQAVGGFAACSLLMSAFLGSRTISRSIFGRDYVSVRKFPEDWSFLFPAIEVSLAVSIGALAIVIVIGALIRRFVFTQ